MVKKKTPEKPAPKKTPAKSDAKKKKTPSVEGQSQRFKTLLAISFLALVVTAGLIIVVSWPTPAPIAPPVTERMPTHPADTSTVPAITDPVLELEISIPQPLDERVKVAILMDDLGINLERGIAAINLDIPVSVAIIPGEQHATDLMRFAHEKQREILIHMPMEPISYPKNNPGPLGLFISQTDEEIVSKTKHLIELIPYAVGGNNHMGSEFTRHSDKMDLVLAEMEKAQLFFVDSLTISDSVAHQEAKRLGVPTTIRDRFLDNEREVEKISVQLEGLVTLAKKNGHAIGICHPYPETILALELFAQQLDTLNIEIVPLAQLVH
ncbi:MAG: divergent polysaccharide deacetylase family protein [Deltaproteobacteria bacterium]|nr:divergent polysaccharide deacetylase family protein [Deltaproteobacteria bacterium]